ncbi:MAG: phosphotransferase family protein [Sphingobium sp.]
MEALRPDYLTYLREIRAVMRGVDAELQSAKARDDLANAERMLCVMQAEIAYLADNQAQMEARLDQSIAMITPLLDRPVLAELRDGLAAVDGKAWTNPGARLGELRRLFQSAMKPLGALADAGVAEADTVFANLLRHETELFRGVVEHRRAFEVAPDAPVASGSAPAASPAPARQAVTAAAMQAYLRETFPEEAGVEVVEMHNVPGGRSKETTMFTLAGTHSLPAKIVTRADIPGGLVPSKATDEFEIIKIADRYGVPVPKPIHSESDASKLGQTFILVSAVEGRTEGEYFADFKNRVTHPRAVGQQLAGILAKIHSIPLSELSTTHLDPGADLLGLVTDTIETTYEQARSFDFPARVHIESAYRWLKKNMHLAVDTPCMIHCDIGLHNMLIKDGRITAVLDWELATIASPAREIAKIFHLIDALMPRQDFLDAYRAAGGPANALDPDRMNFYAVMNYMVTNQRSRFANELFMTGKVPGIVLGHAGYENVYRVTTLLSNMLQPVYPEAYGPAGAAPAAQKESV